MKKGWEIKELEAVCETGAGGTPLKAHRDYYEGGNIPWLLSGEVSQGEIFEATSFITLKGLNNSSAKLFPPNTVLVAMYGATAGQVGILRFEACTNQAVCGILPSESVLPEFIYYCFLSKKDELVSQATGNAQPNISQIKIRKTKIPVPTIFEQQRIVSILDEAFAAIEQAKENIQRNLQNAKELFQSELNRVFTNKGKGWVTVKLGAVIEYDKTPNKRNDLPYVGLENIESNTGKYLGSHEPQQVKSSTFYFTDEHVLYGRLRPYLNKVLLPDFAGHCSTEIFPILVTNNILREFLYYWLISSNTVEKIDATWTGARMPRANMNAVLDFSLSYPSIKEQQKIVLQLDSISSETKRLEELYQQKLNSLEELKKAILQKAFSGELTSVQAVATT